MSGKEKKNQGAEVCIYLGSAFLGVNGEILAPISQYAKHYSVQPYHIGPIATDDEVKMWRYRTEKLATWEKQSREMAQCLDLSAEESLELIDAAYEQLLEKGSKNVRNVDWDDLSEDGLSENEVRHLSLLLQGKIQAEKARADMVRLKEAQALRITALISALPNIKFVFSKDGVVDAEMTIRDLGSRYVGTEIKYKHIHVLSMLANGPKVSHAPVTKRTIDAVAHTRKSTILAHPIPMATSRNAEGLNNAKNHMTTGMLYMPDSAPQSTKDIHKGKHLPGFVVTVHTKEGHFYANNIIVETRSAVPFIGEDGVVFTSKVVVELPGSDVCATLADTHDPWGHYGVINAAIHCANETEAETFVHLGDMSDFDPINRHAAGQPGAVEGLRLRKSIDGLRRLMDKIGTIKSLKDRVLIDSNHHEWLSEYIKKHPELKGMLDWRTLANEKYPDWNVLLREAGDNTVYRFGSLAFRHGDQESLEAAMEALGDTINGHWHQYYRLGHSGKLGCSCRLGPSYIGNNLTAWQSQFGVHTKFEGWTQTSYHTTLHNDKNKTSSFVFRNKVLTVDWKE